jgi:N-acetylmuramoyl-L-alanine amidase
MRAMIAALLVVGALFAGLCGLVAARADALSALARLLPEASAITEDGAGARVELALSQPVPWRVRLLDDPPRLVLDMREVDWTGIARVQRDAAVVTDLRAGVFRPGWSRLVLQLSAPHLVGEAGMDTTDQGAVVRLRLDPASPADFAAAAARPEPPGWALPPAAAVTPPSPRSDGRLTVVLDPGHGGIDPGAEGGGVTEAALMLTFARELQEALLRDGGFRVVLTRDDDFFVPLERRISIAHAAGADLFLSLHADALVEGEAVGATAYVLAAEAVDAAADALAERHDRDDLLAGVDLSGQDDLVAHVLIDMARTETAPRSAALADALVAAIRAEGLPTHRLPVQSGGFSVLKSPDIPSVLLEVGFLSSAPDLARLTDPAWRGRMASALVTGLRTWAAEDAARAVLRRQ